MENRSPQMGVFPGLLDPAREAADQLIADGLLVEIQIPKRLGLWVAREGSDRDVKVFHTFEHKGENFVIFEQPQEEGL